MFFRQPGIGLKQGLNHSLPVIFCLFPVLKTSFYWRSVHHSSIQSMEALVLQQQGRMWQQSQPQSWNYFLSDLQKRFADSWFVDQKLRELELRQWEAPRSEGSLWRHLTGLDLFIFSACATSWDHTAGSKLMERVKWNFLCLSFSECPLGRRTGLSPSSFPGYRHPLLLLCGPLPDTAAGYFKLLSSNRSLSSLNCSNCSSLDHAQVHFVFTSTCDWNHTLSWTGCGF